jgi:hypothetical protein
MGGDQVHELAFFPGMDVETAKKICLFKRVINLILIHFEFVSMSSQAKQLHQNGNLKIMLS